MGIVEESSIFLARQ